MHSPYANIQRFTKNHIKTMKMKVKIIVLIETHS